MGMSKAALLEEARRTIRDMNHKIGLLNKIEAGTLYEFRTSYNNAERYLVKVKSLNRLSIRFHILARTIKGYSTFQTFYYESVTELKEIPKTYLPLYMSWAWTSEYFARLLMGWEFGNDWILKQLKET